jgi:hypothetical protein
MALASKVNKTKNNGNQSRFQYLSLKGVKNIGLSTTILCVIA